MGTSWMLGRIGNVIQQGAAVIQVLEWGVVQDTVSHGNPGQSLSSLAQPILQSGRGGMEK